MAGKKSTLPDPCSICIMLAGSHVAGVLLLKIFFWSQHARAVIPKVPGFWIANPTAWWMREAVLSKGQYDRFIARLAELKLIEKRQWWFQGNKCLFVRLTPKAIVVLQAKYSSWAAVEILVAQAAGQSPEESALQEGPGDTETVVSKTSNSEFSNSNIENDVPKTSGTKFSNYSNIKQELSELKKTIKAQLPSATGANPLPKKEKKVAGESMVEKIVKSKSLAVSQLKASSMAAPVIFSFEDMLEAWWQAMKKRFPERDDIPAEHNQLPGNFLIALGQFYQLMFEPVDTASGFDFNAHAADFAIFVIEHWDEALEKEWEWAIANKNENFTAKVIAASCERITARLHELLEPWGKGHGLSFEDVVEVQGA